MKNNNYDFEDLSIGSNGIMVYILQKNLNHVGVHLKEDGIFGEKTEEAVKKFQLEHDLDDDGVVDYRIMIEIDLEYEMQHCKAV
jgi:peptidoglycan hydrolase-like protein with peptidoglycan-binding domain